MADDNEIKAKITVDASQVGPAVEGAASNVESALARMKAAEASAAAEIKSTFAAARDRSPEAISNYWSIGGCGRYRWSAIRSFDGWHSRNDLCRACFS
jgi:hypothetical protein